MNEWMNNRTLESTWQLALQCHLWPPIPPVILSYNHEPAPCTHSAPTHYISANYDNVRLRFWRFNKFCRPAFMRPPWPLSRTWVHQTTWKAHQHFWNSFRIQTYCSFFNYGDSKATIRSKVEARFLTFWPAVDFNGGSGEMAESILPVHPRKTPWYDWLIDL